MDKIQIIPRHFKLNKHHCARCYKEFKVGEIAYLSSSRKIYCVKCYDIVYQDL